MADAHEEAMSVFASRAARYLEGDEFSDFTIACEGKEFKVHRCIISLHSEFFHKCCSGSFEEAKNQRVELKEDQKEVVEQMIRFFYTQDYHDKVTTDPLPEIESGRPANRAQMNAWVYSIADKYDVRLLKALALEKFTAHIRPTDIQEMIGAVWTVFKHAEIPQDDKEDLDALQQMVCSKWLGAGEKIEASLGREALMNLNVQVPRFMPTCQSLVFRGLDVDDALLACAKCNREIASGRHVAQDRYMSQAELRCSFCSCREMDLRISLGLPGAIDLLP